LEKSVVYEITIGSRKQIGSTYQFETRMKQHKKSLEEGAHCNSFMQYTFNKYRTFEARILSEHPTREEAYIEEQILLDRYYNQAGYLMQNKNATMPPVKWGSDNPRSKPEVIAKGLETKNRNGTLSPSQETRNKIGSANRGRVQSEEEKSKRTESGNISRKREGHRELHRAKVLESFERRTNEAKLNSTELFRNSNPSYKIQTCSYCNRDIQGASAFNRFHGENCKQNNNNNKT